MWKPESANNKFKPASTARISSDEYQRIIEHVENCTSCHSAHAEFLSFLEQLPAAEFDKVKGDILRHLEKGGLEERFIERARAAGIQFSDTLVDRRQPKFRLVLPYRWVVAAAVLGMIMVAMGQRVIHRGPRPSLETGTQAPEQRTLTAQAESHRKLEARLRELQAEIDASKQENLELKDENSQMLTQIDALVKDINAKRAEKQALQQSLVRLRDVNAQQASQIDNNAQLLAHTQAELEETRTRGKAMEAELGAEKAELGALSQQLGTQTATLAQDRELLAEGRDITDLMGARNLHIIDVRDADGRGKNKKSFGRIFYTEGKSLIFYAYDLDESKIVKANYSFAVWGERLGEPTSVRNLGILYTDNKDQKRWAFKVDDPQQLAEIDSVFVTLEAHQGDSTPRGGRILFAYLGGKANHP
jgi:hypothetical protein